MWQKPDRQGGCISQKPDRQGGCRHKGYKQMYDSHFAPDEFQLAYLITIRCFGTWLHGDERLTVDRHGLNIYGTSRRPANASLERVMK